MEDFTILNDLMRRSLMYAELGQSLEEQFRSILHTEDEKVKITPMPDDIFWQGIDVLRERLFNTHKMEQAWFLKRYVDNLFWDVLDKGEWKVEAWFTVVGFLLTYQKKCSDVYRVFDKMIDFWGGDDSFGDLCDSSPLLGKRMFDRVMASEFGNFPGFDEAAKKDMEAIHNLICRGENYMQMKMKEKLLYFLPNVARHAKQDQEEPEEQQPRWWE